MISLLRIFKLEHLNTPPKRIFKRLNLSLEKICGSGLLLMINLEFNKFEYFKLE